MSVAGIVRNIEATKDFMEWKRNNNDSYLTSTFAMFSEGEKREWLISYYGTKNEKITTFSKNNKKGQEEVFKKENDIPELKLEEVKVTDAKALETAKRVLQDNYKNEREQKTILVLQKLKDEALWNITFITAAFKIVNVKISAVTGQVISNKISAISDFMQKS